jgi:hypothetical protein
MEVVSQLCFAEGTPPSEEVVQKLLSYIIGRVGKKKVERVVSKELTIFDDSIDPTPVVRSFLLQHLMQTRYIIVNTRLMSISNRNNKTIVVFFIYQNKDLHLHNRYKLAESKTSQKNP